MRSGPMVMPTVPSFRPVLTAASIPTTVASPTPRPCPDIQGACRRNREGYSIGQDGQGVCFGRSGVALDNASTPGNNATVNLVSVTVPAAAVGSGTAQAMTTNSTVGASSYDGFAFCNTPAQLYVGGYYRYNSTTSGAAATLTATSPANLVSAAGDTIPFTQISWTSSGNGDSGTQPFPAGSFTGTTQTLGTIARNQWAESCHTFSYANTAIRPAGTYTGRVTYTLTAP